MIYLLVTIIGILLTIFFVIGSHEAAHFIAARLLNVKVLRFSIGFGKTLFRYIDKKGTEYVIALIPLGGYVKMLDENEEAVPQDELPFAFNRQPFYKKFLIVLAGPVANIFCAFALYWLIFVMGFVTIKPVIGEVTPGSIAALGGLKPQQEIISIDNESTTSWPSILLRILAHAGNQDQLKIETQSLKNKQTNEYLLDLTNWQLEGLTPDPLANLGIKPFSPNIPMVIGLISTKSPAASIFQMGDKIIAMNKKPIKNWSELITNVIKNPEKNVSFTIERKGKVITVPVTIGYQRNWLGQKSGFLGIAPHFKVPDDLVRKIKYGPIEAIPYAWEQVVDFTYFNFLLFGKLVTGKISMQSLGGPITIFESAGEALNYGLLSFIAFLAFLSISIGIINLLPIPGLDGGHLFFQTIEFVIRRPIPEQIMLVLYRLGFILIFFLLLQALVNDILRLY